MSNDQIPKGYKLTEVGVIPENWEVQTVGQAFDIRNNLRLPISKSTRLSIQGQYPYYGPTNIQDYINEYRIEGEHVLIGEDGDHFMKWRDVSMTLLVDGKFNVNNHAHIIRGVNNLTSWFYYFFAHRDLTPYLKRQGAGRFKLNKATLIEIPCTVPPLPEQAAIATVLSDVDELLRSLDRLIAKKRDLKQATMQQLLTGKTRLPGFGEGKGYKLTEIGRVPEDWEVKELSELTWFQEGPGVRNYQFKQSGIKLLNGTNISNGKVVLDTTSRHISEEEAFGKYKHFLVDDGDILIASSGVTIEKFHEKVAFVLSKNLPLCMNTSTIRFKVYPEKITKQYFYFFLQSDLFKVQIGMRATGSAQLNFGPAHLKRVSLIISPNLNEQAAIAQILSDIDTEIAALEQRRDKTRALKQGMMQQLLTGKIRLKY